MKNHLYYLLLSFIFISCESSGPNNEKTNQNSQSIINSVRGDFSPYNAVNTYDYAGYLHNDLLFAYYTEGPSPTSLDSIRQRLLNTANNSLLYKANFGLGQVFISSAELQTILDNPQDALSDHLAASELSSLAKNHFLDFVYSMELLVSTHPDYPIIYSFIAEYEATVTAHLTFSNTEKAKLLHITSTVRYATYAKKKPRKKNRDLDWDWMITSIAGSSAGNDEDYAKGILTAVILDISDTDLTQ